MRFEVERAGEHMIFWIRDCELRHMPVLDMCFYQRSGRDLFEPIVDTRGWLTKHFGVLFLGARVDIASDPVAAWDDPDPVDCGPTARRNLETVEWEGERIAVPPVQYLINANTRRRRLDRAANLRAWLAQTGRVGGDPVQS
jgi:hypothetical protein